MPGLPSTIGTSRSLRSSRSRGLNRATLPRRSSGSLADSRESPAILPPIGRLRRALDSVRTPAELLHRWQGREHFDYPGSTRLLDMPPTPPDLVHGHNLHGGYFDLRTLATLSRKVPVALTLHDEWLLTGHCAYTLGCDRWRTGCGSCPDLTIYPAIRRDATAANWAAKRRIYADSRLAISAPSRWLLDRASASSLAEGATSMRVIPNGVDTSRFKPGDRMPPERGSVFRRTRGCCCSSRIARVATGSRTSRPWRPTADQAGRRLGGHRLVTWSSVSPGNRS